jgi:spore coat polysaccharide biosynthesis protein SpsF
MKVVALVQARMGSTRFRGKVLKEVSGKPMLKHVIDRLKHAKTLSEIIIATSVNERDKPIVELSKRLGVGCFVGSEEDVLDRFLKAAEQARADVIVRVTADCPLIDPCTVDKIVSCHLQSNVDYTRTLIDENNNKSFPRGLDTEVFSMKLLRRIHELAKDPYEREHVTVFIYNHPQFFRIEVIEAEGILQMPSYRLCVDVEDDLRLIREIYDRLYNPNKIIDIKEVIKLLNENPELQKINVHVKQKPLVRKEMNGNTYGKSNL